MILQLQLLHGTEQPIMPIMC